MLRESLSYAFRKVEQEINVKLDGRSPPWRVISTSTAMTTDTSPK
jgi:hypothetical protein